MNRFITILALIFTVGLANAQQVSFSASAPRVVEVGEQFRLTYSLNKKGTGIKMGELKGFQLLMGPSISQSFSSQYKNGKMTTNTEFSFTYVLMAEKEGAYTLPSATVNVDGKKITSNTVRVEVVKASKKPQQNNNRRGRPQQRNYSISNDNLFVRVELDRKSCYLGEYVIATLKLYSKLDISNLGRSKYPAFDGFLTQDIEMPQQISLNRENVNGTIYRVGTLRKLVLFPQHSGEITIAPFELDVYVRQRMQSSGGGFFDDFFDNYQTVKVGRKSKPIKVKVKELPAVGKPLGFKGSVGKFTLSSSMSRDSVLANDAVTVKVKIKGNGNLKLVEPLDLKFPADFEVYDPKTSQDIKSGVYGTSGTVAFEYVVIPRSAGDYTIPPARFSYFDTRTKKYKTLETKEFVLHVKKGRQTASTSDVVTSFSKEDVKFIGKDIRYIKNGNVTLNNKGEFFFGSIKFILLYIISLLLFVVALLLNKRRIKNNSDIARVKNKRATKIAKKRLKAAEAGMKSNQREVFYDELLKALWGYTSDKLNIPLSDLSKENIAEVFRQRDLSDEDIADYMEILDSCEFARYAPARGEGELGDMYNKTTKVILNLEKSIK